MEKANFLKNFWLNGSKYKFDIIITFDRWDDFVKMLSLFYTYD